MLCFKHFCFVGSSMEISRETMFAHLLCGVLLRSDGVRPSVLGSGFLGCRAFGT